MSPGHSSSSSSSRSRVDSDGGGRCEASICYSYLVAIISSFLVVLGIYLTTTRFNIRYLYISLAGLLFEAIGACVYCLSKIQTNASARRKATTIEANARWNTNSNLLLDTHPNHTAHTDQPSGPHQPLAAGGANGGGTITHILSNGTLTGRTSMDNITEARNQTNDDPTNHPPTAIVIGRTTSQQTQGSPPNIGDINLQSEDRDECRDSSIPSNSITILASVKENQPESRSKLSSPSPSNAQMNELPKIQPFQEPAKSSETNNCSIPIIDQDRIQVRESSQVQGIVLRLAADVTDNSAQVNVSQISDNINSFPSNNAVETDENSSCQFVECEPSAPREPTVPETMASSSNQPPDPVQVSDLSGSTPTQLSGSGGLIPSDAADSAALRKSAAARVRQANLRRTLVMGLGGEEEMIEIDEEDLDNMSILPPPYESIVTEPPRDRQQYSDI